MSTHWTYCTPANYSDLQQGDIIGRKDELLEVLKGVHSYFCDERYTAFLVLTQSCDLVRRKRGECKARHISLATIREMDQVLPSMIQELSGSRYQSILLRERKSVAEEFLERLIDQNEQARGLFYLHPAADAGIAVASLAFLRVTITLRQEHYDILTNCRVGRLQPEFSNKLGWLVGNLYSRIGTPDWKDKAGDESGSNLVKHYLSDVAPEHKWVPEAWVREAEKKEVDLASLTDNPASELASYAPPSTLEVVLDELHRNAVAVRFDAISGLLKERIRGDQSLIAMAVDDIVAKFASTGITNEAKSLAIALRDHGRFAEAFATWVSAIVSKAKSIEEDDPFKRAIDAARNSNFVIPPVRNIVDQIISEIAEEGMVVDSSILQVAPVLSEKTLDRVASILADFGTGQWTEELQKLKGRLRNSSKLKSAVG
jgi:hypothetical protein